MVLTTPPILRYSDIEAMFILDMYANSTSFSGILSQNKTESLDILAQRYLNQRRTAVSLLAEESVELFYKYLYWRESFCYKQTDEKVARWIELLQEYNFDNEYPSPGIDIITVALSKGPCPEYCRHCRIAEEDIERSSETVLATGVVDENYQAAELSKEQRTVLELRQLTGNNPD